MRTLFSLKSNAHSAQRWFINNQNSNKETYQLSHSPMNKPQTFTFIIGYQLPRERMPLALSNQSNHYIYDIIRQTLIVPNILSLTEFWWPYQYSNHGYKHIMLTPKSKWEHIHNHDATKLSIQSRMKTSILDINQTFPLSIIKIEQVYGYRVPSTTSSTNG